MNYHVTCYRSDADSAQYEIMVDAGELALTPVDASDVRDEFERRMGVRGGAIICDILPGQDVYGMTADYLQILVDWMPDAVKRIETVFDDSLKAVWAE